MIPQKVCLRFSALSAFLILLFMPALSARGNVVPIINISPGTGPYYGFNEAHYDGMIGWSFTLHQPLTIKQVGWYDEGQDGLSRPFQIGLWNSSSTQLLGTPSAGITIPAGSGAALNGPWRVVDLAVPLQLPPGNYSLGGLDTATTTDTIVFAMSSSQLATLIAGSPVDLGEFFYGDQSSPGFHQPQWFYLAPGLELGPMLFYDAVPEPSAVLLLSLAAASLLVRTRRSRRPPIQPVA